MAEAVGLEMSGVWKLHGGKRKSRACKETSVRTIFNHHMTTTVITDHIGLFIMDVYFLQLFLGSIHIMFQIRIEVPDYCLPAVWLLRSMRLPL